MKLSHITIGLVAMSVTPFASAFAQSPTPDAAGRDYAIRIVAAASPAAPDAVRYPVRAASRGLSGDCSLTLDVAATGEARNVRLLACSSALFEREVKRAASQLRFAGDAQANIPVQIQWDMRQAESQLARLD